MIEEDKIYESSLMKKIINFSNEKLGDGTPIFHEKKMDAILTSEILYNLDAKNKSIDDIERVIIHKKSTIQSALRGIKSSLSKEPIIIFLFYLVYADEYALRENWHLDEGILKELFYRLGISYNN